MASHPDRFRSATDALDWKRLFVDARRAALWGLIISLAATFSGIGYAVYFSREREAPPPALTRLVIRKPQSKTQFVLKRQRLRPRAMTKEVTAMRPRMQRPVPRVQGLQSLGSIASFDYRVDTDLQTSLDMGPIDLSAARVQGTKEPERRIAMREELIDLKALDTGRYKGLIIQDPSDRRNVKGFVYLGTGWATDLEPNFDSAAKAIPNLVLALNQQTGITARVDAHLFLDSQELFRTPFVFITAQEAFELTDREIANLGEYLRRGGFLFVDNANPTAEYSQAEASLRQIFSEALRGQGVLQHIDNDHPIYHVFYDFDGPPVGSELEVGGLGSQRGNESVTVARSSYHLEGVFIDGRLVALYSDKGYVHTWARNYGNEPQLRFGINAVIFALTQEGSIAQQQIDFYSEGGG
jgi:hypothetical protein